jgi:hypothetical protein
MNNGKRRGGGGFILGLAGLALLVHPVRTADWAKVLDAKNMRIVGHNELNGNGDGGEGLALHQYADGRRILFLAHESEPMCFSVVDVTKTSAPVVVTQVPIVSKDIRCNSLGVSGTTLVVAHQTNKVGLPNAGMRVYDISNPSKPTEVAFFDTSGPYSNGVHYVTFIDGYAYLTTGAKDFESVIPSDRQFFMIVDVRNPRQPKEVGRWWIPGTRKGDTEAPPARPKANSSFRMHSALVSPERPDRAYIGWVDAGVIILDIADKAHPKFVSRTTWYPPDAGFAHTLMPIPDRNLAIVTEEASDEKCVDGPKVMRTLDISDEKKPRQLAVFPEAPNRAELCKEGRYGAHNIHQNQPGPFSRQLKQTVVASLFNGGVRIYSIADPKKPEEIGYLIPTAPPGNKFDRYKADRIFLNDVFVDEKGVIYTNDRLTGGLYILEYTGSVPLR